MEKTSGVWVVTEKARGPHGHGEPGQEYIALSSVAGAYESPIPAPAFLTEDDAKKFVENQKGWWLSRTILFLPIHTQRSE